MRKIQRRAVRNRAEQGRDRQNSCHRQKETRRSLGGVPQKITILLTDSGKETSAELVKRLRITAAPTRRPTHCGCCRAWLPYPVGFKRFPFTVICPFRALHYVCKYKLTRTFPLMFHFAKAFWLSESCPNGGGRRFSANSQPERVST